MSQSKDKVAISDKIKQLEKEVAWFEGDDFVIEQALERYQALAQLSNEIEHDLADLENTITNIGKQ